MQILVTGSHSHGGLVADKARTAPATSLSPTASCLSSEDHDEMLMIADLHHRGEFQRRGFSSFKDGTALENTE